MKLFLQDLFLMIFIEIFSGKHTYSNVSIKWLRTKCLVYIIKRQNCLFLSITGENVMLLRLKASDDGTKPLLYTAGKFLYDIHLHKKLTVPTFAST